METGDVGMPGAGGEKPMRHWNIALTGFRATGKSAVGRLLAAKLRWDFVDMDEHLVAELGQDIRSWVSAYGWGSFRERESVLLKRLASSRGQVVATGGGVVVGPANRRILRDGFFVVWLKASTAVIVDRLARDPETEAFRPPLTDKPPEEEVERILHERWAWYEETADLIVETDGLTPEDVLEAIQSRMA